MNSPKIGIDARFVTSLPRRGIGNYSLNLINELVKIDPTVQYYLYIRKADKEKVLPSLPNVIIRRLWMPFYPLWENVALPLAAWRDRVDILHCLGNTAPMFVPPKVNLILSLMDVMFLRSDDFIPIPTKIYQKLGRLYRSFIVPRCIFRADKVITISDFSKNDILDLIPRVHSSNIIVTYLSCDKQFAEIRSNMASKSKDLPLAAPYIFCLGAEDPRKNTLRLVRSYIRLVLTCDIRENLIISGYTNWEGSDSHRVIVDSGLEDRVQFLGFVDINDLSQLYQNATVFVYPSVYEGFGIPLLEAFSSGCPVAASNITSIPEVAGDAAIYFDPLNESEIAQALLRVINDVDLRNSLRASGYARASHFCWNNTAKQTLSVYKKCMDIPE